MTETTTYLNISFTKIRNIRGEVATIILFGDKAYFQ